MHCANCGNQLGPDDEFCGNCGAPAPAAQQWPSAAPVTRSRAPLVIAGVVVAAIVVIAAVLLLSGGDDSKSTPAGPGVGGQTPVGTADSGTPVSSTPTPSSSAVGG